MSYHLRRSLFIPRPRHEVFAFFADAENLERITPAFLKFHITSPRPIAMHLGTLIDYEMKLHGIPLRWRTRIDAFEPDSHFIDIQLSGPYRTWRHRHDFQPADGGTWMYDHVRYDLPFGPLGSIAHALFVRRIEENKPMASAEQILRFSRWFLYRNYVISTEARSAQWRDPCICLFSPARQLGLHHLSRFRPLADRRSRPHSRLRSVGNVNRPFTLHQNRRPLSGGIDHRGPLRSIQSVERLHRDRLHPQLLPLTLGLYSGRLALRSAGIPDRTPAPDS